MFRQLRRLVFLGVILGVGLQLLRRIGLLGDGECGPSCDCSNGSTRVRLRASRLPGARRRLALELGV